MDFSTLTISNYSRVAIGICDNRSKQKRTLDWSHGSWAYYGRRGNKYGDNYESGTYGPVYGTGDVIGCGIDWKTGIVFFTKNGESLGKIQGMLI